MERAELEHIERIINFEIQDRFPPDSVRRVAVLRHEDAPAVGEDELLIRVFVTAEDQPGLDGWRQEHEPKMTWLRRELSLRLPPAKLLEFTVGEAADAPRIVLAEDPGLLDEEVTPREIVTEALASLRRRYVFPDRAEEAATAIEARLAAGDYDDLAPQALAERLTGQLFEVCADKHLRVVVHGHRPHRMGGREPGPDEPRPVEPEGSEPHGPGHGGPGGPADPRSRGPALDRDRRKKGPPDNYGIHRVERLKGNIGYIDVRRVAPPGMAGPAISAAMELVSGTEALILDLRENGGGAPDGVVYWCSYLVPMGRNGTHFNDIYERESGETKQFWSLPWLPGSRYLDRPVYVLSSDHTFSGGEDFCYTLQAIGRAEVIGERTGGGAHPTRMIPIGSTMAIGVPFARSINPVTGTNWEGTGVTPAFEVPAEEAFGIAYERALRHVLAAEAPPPVKVEASEALDALGST